MSSVPNGTTFIKNLSKLLRYEGLSPNAFAKKIGFPSSTLYRYFKENRLPSAKFKSKFASEYKEINMDLFINSPLGYIPERKLNYINECIHKEISYSLDVFHPETVNEWLSFNEVYEYSTKKADYVFKYYECDGERKTLRNLDALLDYSLINRMPFVLYDLFEILPKREKVSFSFNEIIGKYRKEDNTIQCIETWPFEDLRLLSCVFDADLRVESNTSDDDINGFVEVNGKQVSFSSFDPKLTVVFNIECLDGLTPSLLQDYYTTTLSVDVYGIEKDRKIPLWVEYIITSWSLYKDGNERMAFFMAFASLDCVIELLCNSIHNAYHSLAVSELDIIMIRDYCGEKCNSFSNERRRLIEEKLQDVMKEKGVFHTKEGEKLYNKLIKYEKVRNEIAHCDKEYSGNQYSDLLRTIIQLLCLIKTGKNLSAFVKMGRREKPKPKEEAQEK